MAYFKNTVANLKSSAYFLLASIIKLYELLALILYDHLQLMVIIPCFKSLQAIEVVKNKEYSTLNYKIILNHLSTCVKKKPCLVSCKLY